MSRTPSFIAAGFALAVAVHLAAAPGHLVTEAVWHDNVTNAERPEDRLPAWQWTGELEAGHSRNLADGHRLRAAVHLRTELWPRLEGLNQVAPGVTLGWDFKPGLGPHRPRLTAELEAGEVRAHERDRSGGSGAGRLQIRQRVRTDWLLLAGHEWRRFDARGRAFDRTGREWFGRVEWSASPVWVFVAEGRERVGDVVSYSRPPRPDLEAIGKPITLVDTFEQGVPWIAYYFRARTRSGAVEVQRAFGRTGITLRHELRHTLHAGPGYRNQLTTLRFATAF
ncbi:hypothetical protein ESB00_17015 [Oleiharenicola lentus]|jgi:hypothetical protein|uniref:Uncharacterized protein n=1 Tax=Oleiharenicola lentus TaxID=2508720 RepID=A0A4Q1C522_9BACT|nr:hypothetical protein [Oleiharenicola lentus]RXK53395.1 hypothetical protein ESB00_17015 [Oleiharenicola lentus]